MNTKIVYVSTSGIEDHYFEETVLSAYSLKLYQTDAYLVLVVDQDTRKAITGNREKLLCYFDELKVVQCPDEYNQHQRSRYLKTTLRELIKGDFLYIDGDTIICQPLDDIEKCHASVAAVIDKHLALAVHPRCETTDYKLYKYFGYNREGRDQHFFNSGVLYVRDTKEAHDFFKEWHRLWKDGLSKGLGIDQPSLLIANHNCDYLIQELDGIWNCQVMDNGLKFLYNAKILHYFASNTFGEGYLLKESKVFVNIKHTGVISEEIKTMVDHAKECFSSRISIIAGKDAEFLESSIHKCYLYHPRIYNFIEKLLRFLFKVK